MLLVCRYLFSIHRARYVGKATCFLNIRSIERLYTKPLFDLLLKPGGGCYPQR